MLDQNDPMRLSAMKKRKKSPKVTFDDSLNTDLLYDPGVSSIHPTKNNSDLIKERNKKSNFISVYSNRQLHLDGENNSKEPRGRLKNNSAMDYSPSKFKSEEYEYDLLQFLTTHRSEDDPRVQSLFDERAVDKSDTNESRLSKLTEDQAAAIFEKRYTQCVGSIHSIILKEKSYFQRIKEAK